MLCSERVSQMTKAYHDIEAVTRLLEEVYFSVVDKLSTFPDWPPSFFLATEREGLGASGADRTKLARQKQRPRHQTRTPRRELHRRQRKGEPVMSRVDTCSMERGVTCSYLLCFDQISQLRHELHKKENLLQLYDCDYDADFPSPVWVTCHFSCAPPLHVCDVICDVVCRKDVSTVDVLKRKVRQLEEENEELKSAVSDHITV